jgi:hypothetical protein
MDILKHVKSEDLITYGFESEFVGRLPVKAIFETLSEDDLFEILRNPSNPIILGKKLDFAAYGIDVKFERQVLRVLAKNAFSENTGARGLVSAVEKALLLFEKKLPSTSVKKFPVTLSVIDNPEKSLEELVASSNDGTASEVFEKLTLAEKESIKEYVKSNEKYLAQKYSLAMTPSRVDIVADFYTRNTMDIGNIIKKIKDYCDEIKKIELSFFKSHDINIVMEEDAIDFIIEQIVHFDITIDDFYKQLSTHFEHGLKLIREKTGRNRFFITRQAILNPDAFVGNLIKDDLSTT